jgi:DNA-binding LacI/PurR family transcriptional regulator
MADVARAAEVSTATVSNALNGNGRMSELTRRHVRSVAAALGYLTRPAPRAPGARMLGLGVTTFGDVAWDFATVAYFSRVIATATAAAHRHGYALTVMPAGPGSGDWQRLDLAGALLVDPPVDDPVTRLLRDAGVPVAFAGRPADARPEDIWADNDHAAVVRVALDHLAGRGARRIGLIAGPGTDHYTQSCIAAYRHWCAERGQRALIAPIVPGSGADVAALHLMRHRHRPDAIYGIYDMCGRAVIDAARHIGCRIPEDLLVACMSEDPGYATTDPPITTVSLAPDLCALASIAALIQKVESHTTASPTVVPARLVPRASSRARV